MKMLLQSSHQQHPKQQWNISKHPLPTICCTTKALQLFYISVWTNYTIQCICIIIRKLLQTIKLIMSQCTDDQCVVQYHIIQLSVMYHFVLYHPISINITHIEVYNYLTTYNSFSHSIRCHVKYSFLSVICYLE